jgi:hypothetical protein
MLPYRVQALIHHLRGISGVSHVEFNGINVFVIKLGSSFNKVIELLPKYGLAYSDIVAHTTYDDGMQPYQTITIDCSKLLLDEIIDSALQA